MREKSFAACSKPFDHGLKPAAWTLQPPTNKTQLVLALLELAPPLTLPNPGSLAPRRTRRTWGDSGAAPVQLAPENRQLALERFQVFMLSRV